jgi:hypothetical protein
LAFFRLFSQESSSHPACAAKARQCRRAAPIFRGLWVIFGFFLDKTVSWLYIVCIIGKDAVKDYPVASFFLFSSVLRLVKRGEGVRKGRSAWV